MQMMVLAVSLVLMAVVTYFFWRSITSASTPAEAPDASRSNRLRGRLILALTAFGVVVSVLSLREWPHAIAAPGAGTVVTVTGGQWWWDIDKEELPLGEPVTFRVVSEDVNHGMGVYDSDLRLLFQTQGMPGYVNKVTYTFERPGTYRVLCMEFCGVAHHDMTYEFQVVAGE